MKVRRQLLAVFVGVSLSGDDIPGPTPPGRPKKREVRDDWLAR